VLCTTGWPDLAAPRLHHVSSMSNVFKYSGWFWLTSPVMFSDTDKLLLL
jgi:hypothetical protein